MKKYTALRDLMRERGVSNDDAGYVLGIPGQSVSQRLGGKTAWRIDECYALLVALGKGPEYLPIYFPPEGDDRKAPRATPATLSASVLRAAQMLSETISLALEGGAAV